MNHVPLGSPLASGNSAEVFLWKKEYVLKLFFEHIELQAIENEQEISRTIHISGLPVPKVGEIVEINGRYGLVYQRIHGTPLMDIMFMWPGRIPNFARLFTDLHFNINMKKNLRNLPSLHRRLKKKILAADILTADEKRAVIELLENLAKGDCLCHGDFHPGNVMMTKRGPVIIDWPDATRGNLLADVARSSLLIGKAHISGGNPPFIVMKLFRHWILRTYLKRYFSFHPEGLNEFPKWLIVTTAGRLSEDIPERKSLAVYVQTKLRKILNKPSQILQSKHEH